MQQKQINKIFKFNVIFWLISMRYKFLLKSFFDSLNQLLGNYLYICVSRKSLWKYSLFYKDYRNPLFTATI